MNDIEQKALALINAEIDYDPTANDAHEYKALCRAIEQHEAIEQELHDFKQEVSDAVEGFMLAFSNGADSLPSISRFIIPKPKSDPLVDVLKDFGGFMPDADDFRAALEARGLTITTKEKD